MKLRQLTFAWMLAIGLAAFAANTTRNVTQVTSGVQLTTDVDYVVSSTTPFTTAGSVDIINTDHAVLILAKVKPSKVLSSWMDYIYINGQKAVDGTNCQVKMYGRGTIILPYASDIRPLTCYTEQNFGGDSYSGYSEGHSGGFMKSLATNSLNNKIRSFKLKRGYMVTFAIGTAGWGYSRCFIADQADLEVAELPAILDQRISSYRIFKWHNAHKAGLASNGNKEANQALNTSWCYDWAQGNSGNMPDVEWVPNHIYEDYPSASTCGSVNGSCHMKTNNEPGNSADDHPQEVATVLGNWQNLMRTGMRLCSESSHDGSMNHLKAFIDSIDARGWRCDILDLHCYWPSSSFGSLTWYSDHYGNGRPIWISEWIWGASWNHNGAFGDNVSANDILNTTKSLLETINGNDRVERYAYWNSESKGHIYEGGSLTSLGQYYATMDVGLGYNAANEFIPKDTRLESLSELTASYSKGTTTLTWTDPNGDLMNTISVMCKLPGTTKFVEVASITPKDKNSAAGITYTYSEAMEEPGVYTYRVQAVSYNSKKFTSKDVVVNVDPAQGTDTFQYGKLQVTDNEQQDIIYSAAFSEAPCVFMGTITNKNSTYKAGNVVGTKQSSTHFTYQSYPWQTNTGALNKAEEIPFMALKAGNYKFDDLDCEVGIVSSEKATGTDTWTDVTTVTFTKPFPEGVTPVVLTEIRNPGYITGTTSLTTLSCRIFDVTNTGFKFIIYSEDASGRKISQSKKVCYFAITPGFATLDAENGLIIAAGQGRENQIYGASQRENSFTVDVCDESGNVTDVDTLRLFSPHVFTNLQTNNYPVTCTLRRTDITERDNDGNTWVRGTKVSRQLDHAITVDGQEIPTNSGAATYAAYRENIAWVAVAIAKAGGSLPTEISIVDEEKSSDSINPRVVDGRIYVDGAANVSVFTTTGTPVANKALEPGIYVVKANSTSAKIIVK